MMVRKRMAILLAGAAMAPPALAAETVAYRYDARGRLVEVTRTGTGNAGTTAYSFDKADNRLAVAVTGASGPGPVPPGPVPPGPGPAPSGAGVIVVPGNPYRIIPIG